MEQQPRLVAHVERDDLADEDDVVASLLLVLGAALEHRCIFVEQRGPGDTLRPAHAGELVPARPPEAVRYGFLRFGEDVDREVTARTELKLLAVTPTGAPAPSVVVTTVTPVANAPSACRTCPFRRRRS